MDKVKQLAEPICVGEGLELIQVKFINKAGGMILQIYLDKPGGILLDDCINISRQLSDVLDVALDLKCAYRLEVSSPGPDRPLTQLNDFHRFEGHQVQIKLKTALNGRKNFKGLLMGKAENKIQILADQNKITFDYHEIAGARLINYNGEN